MLTSWIRNPKTAPYAASYNGVVTTLRFTRPAVILLALVTAPIIPAGTPAAARAAAGQTAVPQPYDAVFTPAAMRVDYFHTGGLGTEVVVLDRVVADGVWPGNRTHLVDTMNLGHYLFEVVEPRTGEVLYSRGFSSIFAEWDTTAEAKQIHRTFHESLRFPWPKAPVRVVLQRRTTTGKFRDLWSLDVDPEAPSVVRADVRPVGTVWTLVENGPAAEKVDLLLIGDGYTDAEMPKFHADAARLVKALFAVEPYRNRQADFNVRAIDLPSTESGINRPQAGVFRRSLLATAYDVFGIDRYVLAGDNRMLRDVASVAPYEFIEILVNDRTYGGGGIFNLQATVAVDSGYAEYVFIHEFAHHFAGLGDEYYSSDVAYETGGAEHPEPWEPNLTALNDPSALKWRDLVSPGTPLPTPWNREAFEKRSPEFRERRAALREQRASEADIDVVHREEEAWQTRFLAELPHSGQVGAFEGAGYKVSGLYRPSTDCIMFTRDTVGFCRVCQRAIVRIIDEYATR